MNNEESAQIVDFVAAADGRNVSPQTYGAWHLIIGHLGFEQTRAATLMALQDPDIRWVEPKHVLAKVSKLIDQAKADERRARALTASDEPKGSPMPICEHGKGLLYCGPCCHRAAFTAGLVKNPTYRPKTNAL